MVAASHESDPLIQFLNVLQPLSAELIEEARKETFKIFVRKNNILPSFAELVKDGCLFFVAKGLVRAFVVDDGKDITTWLTDENDFIGNIRNPGTFKPTFEEQYQALEDSELLVLPYRVIDDMYTLFPEANVLARKLLAIQYHMSQERSILSRIPSAEARYKQFKIGHPTIRSRVPLKFLASYLGMRIETLSRIRKKGKIDASPED